MRKNMTGWLILLAILATFCSAGTASAMSAFSRKYKMQCDGCHTSKLPQLNEFGIEFYKNGFVLSKQSDVTKAGAGEGGIGGKEKTLVQAESKAPAKGSDINNLTGDEGEEGEPPPKKEIPPTVVYRSKSHDGTVFFTDTPERRTDFSWQQDNGEKEPAETGTEKIRQPKKKKTAASRHQAARRSNETGAVKVVEKERYRSYEQCMERQLIGAEQPDSSRDMMDLMITAERKCAGYSLERR
ncbi:hypothetical protein [Geobacter argillaceus]|nr:hypothetical protein [Geobacter argillaceus]